LEELNKNKNVHWKINEKIRTMPKPASLPILWTEKASPSIEKLTILPASFERDSLTRLGRFAQIVSLDRDPS
jgi:hypothetical protein